MQLLSLFYCDWNIPKVNFNIYKDTHYFDVLALYVNT